MVGRFGTLTLSTRNLNKELRKTAILIVFVKMANSDSLFGTKRKLEDDPSEKRIVAKKPCCQHGIKCYRKNEHHFLQYSHPHLDELLAKKTSDGVLPPNMYVPHVKDQLAIVQKQQQQSTTAPQSTTLKTSSLQSSSSQNPSEPRINKPLQGGSTVAAKVEAAAPYFFFLTRTQSSRATHSEPLSISFHELLDPSLGRLGASLQMNFMVEMDWLDTQYSRHDCCDRPRLILYGDLSRGVAPPRPNVTAVKVHTPSPFGHHHSKISILYYEDCSLRVVVHTANLIESDWENRTQGVWVSPACPCLPQPGARETDGESPTRFKESLLQYMRGIDLRSQPDFQEWIRRIGAADFSVINVFFIASIPKTHRFPESEKWGHKRLRNILKAHATVPSSAWPVIAQCSSIGSLGPNPSAWMCGELLHSFSQHCRPADKSQPLIKLVYPSLSNVVNSCDGIAGGGCLPYQKATHLKQAWLADYMHEWKCAVRHRTANMPHIKTYARVSPCSAKLAWFHLSSANLSKAAWGSINKDKTGLYLMSYEAGVLFLPKFVLQGSATEFSLTGQRTFPLPYDLPLSPYAPSDTPWFFNTLQEAFNRRHR